MQALVRKAGSWFGEAWRHVFAFATFQGRKAHKHKPLFDERHRLLVEAVCDYALVLLRPDGTIDSWNPGAERVFGFRASDIIGRSFSILYPASESSQAVHLGHLQQALKEGCVKEEGWRIRKDGGRCWVYSAITPMREQNGELAGYAYVCSDITDRKMADEEHEKRAAEVANKAKDEFLAVLGHELRTPLTPVMAVLPVLEEDMKLPSDVREELAMMHRNIELEARLIDDLLDVNAMHRGPPHLDLRVVDFHGAVMDTLQILRSAIMSRRHQLTIELDAAQHFVKADYTRLQQIVWNLLANAVKFTPQRGEITLRSRNQDGWIVLEITDTGIGIQPDILPAIFEEFEQGDARKLYSSSGLGLGLALSKRLVELHGGRLSASSLGKGMGATFTVELLATAEKPQRSHPSGDGNGVGANLGTVNVSQKLRLLLVEDDEHTIQVLTRLLRRAGHDVTPARSVHSALAAAGVSQFDLLVSDIGLPDGSGYDLMRELKCRYNLPGIAISGFGMEQDFQRSREVGFSAHVMKPLDVQRLKRVMCEVSSGRRAG